MAQRPVLMLGLAALLAACQPPFSDISREDTGEKEHGLLQIAAGARSAGNLEGAAELYRRAAAESKHSVTAHLELASLYRQQRKPELAVEILREAQKRQPKNVRVLSALGGGLIAAGRPEEALPLFDEALTQDTHDIGALNGRGVALDNMDRHEDAQKSYRRALIAEPESSVVLNNLALSLILSDDYAEAAGILEKLVARPDALPTMRQNLALAYGLQGNHVKAMELGLKDLPPEEAQENLKFYEYYAGLRQAGVPSHRAVPVAPVELRPAASPPVEAGITAVPAHADPAELAKDTGSQNNAVLPLSDTASPSAGGSRLPDTGDEAAMKKVGEAETIQESTVESSPLEASVDQDKPAPPSSIKPVLPRH